VLTRLHASETFPPAEPEAVTFLPPDWIQEITFAYPDSHSAVADKRVLWDSKIDLVSTSVHREIIKEFDVYSSPARKLSRFIVGKSVEGLEKLRSRASRRSEPKPAAPRHKLVSAASEKERKFNSTFAYVAGVTELSSICDVQ
jgi:hypothetical protein